MMISVTDCILLLTDEMVVSVNTNSQVILFVIKVLGALSEESIRKLCVQFAESVQDWINLTTEISKATRIKWGNAE